MRIAINNMLVEDVPKVVSFWEAAGIRRAPSQRALARFLDRGFGKVLRANGKIAAATLFSICGPGQAYFECFAVDPGRRRKGFGRRLYKKCVLDLLQLGVRRVVFLVNKQNEAAHAFWAAVGTSPILGASAYFGRLKRVPVTRKRPVR